MGWGPVDWVGRVLPEPKFENKCTSFFEFFGFERPLLRYRGSGSSEEGGYPERDGGEGEEGQV